MNRLQNATMLNDIMDILERSKVCPNSIGQVELEGDLMRLIPESVGRPFEQKRLFIGEVFKYWISTGFHQDSDRVAFILWMGIK